MATACLVVVLVAVHVALNGLTGTPLIPAESARSVFLNYAFYPARYSPAFLAARGLAPQSFWDLAAPFVSYIFLHGSYTHLIVNCIWLLPFGSLAERRLGAPLFIVFFLVCGVLAAVAHLLTHWGSLEPVVGASGAISGAMGAAFRMIADVNARDPVNYAAAMRAVAHGDIRLAPLLSRRVLTWSALWLAINVVAGLTGLGATPGAPVVVAWQAHIGGYLAGLLLVGLFDRAERPFRI